MPKKAPAPESAISVPQEAKPDTTKTQRVTQADVPAYTLAEAIRVPRAIAEHYGYKASTPLNVAAAMELNPKGSSFRMLCGAALAYGLIDGGAYAPKIEISPLGMKVVRPLEEGQELVAMREALLRPRVVGDFLRKYDNATLPRQDIAHNVLQDLGVPKDRAQQVHELIVEGARSVGFIRQIKGKDYVDLASTSTAAVRVSDVVGPENHERNTEDVYSDEDDTSESIVRRPTMTTPSGASDQKNRRIYITHGKNQSFIEPIKKLLAFGELDAVVSVQKQSVSLPVPDKVMEEMRSCGGAIIHVDDELKLIDSGANEHVVLNPNVLIEIGAAMALYGRRFILLVKDGVKLPSNLQGLFEVRYQGDSLDGLTTIRLLESIQELKKAQLPQSS